MSPSARPAAPPPRRVLLTNDDGPDSEGSPFLRHWIEVGLLRLHPGQRAELRVEVHQQRACEGAAANQLGATSRGPGRDARSLSPDRVTDCVAQLHRRAEDFYEIEGSPATCVNIALHHLASDCDFVVAGERLRFLSIATTHADRLPQFCRSSHSLVMQMLPALLTVF